MGLQGQGLPVSAVLGKAYMRRLWARASRERRSAVEVCQWHAVTGLTNADADLIAVEVLSGASWTDLATAGTPEFLNSKAGKVLLTSPHKQYTPRFFLHRTCGRVSTPYRIHLFARKIYAPAQKAVRV
jgi:hypothetical protein